MALPDLTLPFGLRDVKLIPIASDGTLGTAVDLPAAQTFSFSETESFTELKGDDVTQATHGAGPIVEWDLEAGGISLAAYKVLAGGTTAASGTTPAQVNTFTKLATDSRPYFQVEGQAISDSGGDMHCVVYRCKADGSLEGSFSNGQFWITKAKGKGYGNIFGASPDNKLYVFKQNESVTAIS